MQAVAVARVTAGKAVPVVVRQDAQVTAVGVVPVLVAETWSKLIIATTFAIMSFGFYNHRRSIYVQ